MRTVSAALITAQAGTAAKPHIHVNINSTDYSARLLFLEHREEAYRDRAVLILRNNDRNLDNTDLTGKKFRIGYGHYTGNTVAEPDGDGAGNEYSYAADLWVKDQQIVSAQGELTCQLYCEGHWMYMREHRIRTYGEEPYYETYWRNATIYSIAENILETAMGWTLSALATSDGITDVFQPEFDINQSPYENAAAILYRLMSMTKSYLRVRANSVFDIVYPQQSDAVSVTYYNNQSHRFLEYTSKRSLLIPNSIVVFANQDVDGQWSSLITSKNARDEGHVAKYVEVLEPFLAGSVTTQTDADNRADAILSRVKMEQLSGRLLIPHDARIELYDKVAVVDSR